MRRVGWRPAVFVIAALAAVVAGGAPFPAAAQTTGSSLPGEAPVTEDQRCLALSMYWEARGDGPEGMRAVGSVVLNRVASTDFPDSPCEVVYQGGEKPPCQFSWWCDGRSDRPRDRELWETALALAKDMLSHRGRDPTHGALFFHNARIPVPWRVPRTRTARILGHVYYR